MAGSINGNQMRKAGLAGYSFPQNQHMAVSISMRSIRRLAITYKVQVSYPELASDSERIQHVSSSTGYRCDHESP